MPFEIERKFLVKDDAWRGLAGPGGTCETGEGTTCVTGEGMTSETGEADETGACSARYAGLAGHHHFPKEGVNR